MCVDAIFITFIMFLKSVHVSMQLTSSLVH